MFVSRWCISERFQSVIRDFLECLFLPLLTTCVCVYIAGLCGGEQLWPQWGHTPAPHTRLNLRPRAHIRCSVCSGTKEGPVLVLNSIRTLTGASASSPPRGISPAAGSFSTHSGGSEDPNQFRTWTQMGLGVFLDPAHRQTGNESTRTKQYHSEGTNQNQS